jgi:hypothetical protein
MIKSRRMRCAECIEHMKEMRNEYKILVGKPDGKRQFGYLFTDGRIKLRSILRNRA